MLQKAISHYYHKRISRQRAERHAEFEASSIGDIAFLLLIYFIVTSSFLLKQGIFLSLPSAEAASVRVEKEKLVTLEPQNSGFIYEGRQLNRENLLKALQEHKQAVKEPVVVIRMKDEVAYNRLVDALSAARESGIKKVSLKNI